MLFSMILSFSFSIIVPSCGGMLYLSKLWWFYTSFQGSFKNGVVSALSSRENIDFTDFSGTFQDTAVTYKNVFFILQNIYYLKTGVFCLTKKELLYMLDETDQQIMKMSLEVRANDGYDFEQAFEKLFLWCQNTLIKL